MVILGFDPGIATLGYGVIQTEKGKKPHMLDYGIVSTPKDENIAVRLAMLEKGVRQILDKYKPDEIAIEELFFAKNVTTGMAVSAARGAALVAAAQRTENLYEYTPMQIKQAVTGYGKADKKQIQQMVKMLLNMDTIPKPDDAADAIACAITHCQAGRMREQFRMK